MSGHGVPHHAANQEQKHVGIFIAVLAVIMAVIGALAKAEANKMIVKEVQASNGFAWYQSKRQRSYMNELEIRRADFELAGTVNETQRKLLEDAKGKFKAKNAEYEKENEEIRKKADSDRHDAELASVKHHWFEYAEIATHIAVVLCSLTLLTETMLFYRLGVGATIIGLILTGYSFTIKDVTGHGDSQAGSPAASHSAPAK